MTSTATVAVLFCDLVDSTARLTRLGDTAADAFRRRFFERLQTSVDAVDGKTVKNLGDGLMVVFEHSTVGAIECAADMHRSMADLDPDDPPHLRIGISVGEVSEEDGDWFGTPVIEAARLCSAAATDQTLATAVVRTVIGSRRDAHTFDAVGAMRLKGLAGAIDVDAVDSIGPAVIPASVADLDVATHGSGSRRRVAVLGAMALIAGSIGGWWWLGPNSSEPDEKAETSTTSAPRSGMITEPHGYTPELNPVECAESVKQLAPDVSCSRLMVPEVRSQPEGRQIGVDVTHVPAQDPSNSPPPLLLLDLNEHLETASFRDVTDVYAVTMRGLSPADDPRIECDEIRTAWSNSFAVETDLPASIADRSAAASACAARLRSEGVQLDGYNMVEAATDLRDLVISADLGVVSVGAMAFTTTAAIEFAASNPGMVASLVLSSPTPPGESTIADPALYLAKSLDRVNQLCAVDPGCRNKYGNLRDAFTAKVAQLDAQPVAVNAIPLATGGEPIGVYLDGRRLARALSAALASTPQMGYVPIAVTGDADSQALVASAAINENYRLFVAPGVANGTALSYVCSYDGARPRSAELSNQVLQAFQGVDEPALRELCDAWNVPSIFSDVSGPLTGDVPTFIAQGGISIAGVNDWADVMERTLTRATVLRMDTMSDDLVFEGPACVRELRRQFLQDPSGDLDVESCEAETPAIEFIGAD